LLENSGRAALNWKATKAPELAVKEVRLFVIELAYWRGFAN
jgi:hypothetical protein